MSLFDLKDIYDEQEFGGKAAQLGAAVRYGLPVPKGCALSNLLVRSIVEDEVLAKQAIYNIMNAYQLPVVARSSAVGEDGKMASFAGQFETYLNINTTSHLEITIKKIWNSAFSKHASSYNEKFGFSNTQQMGIVVQEMIRSDISGIMFTQNPLTGVNERIIESSWGLGESIVSGLITPDFYRVNTRGEVLECVQGTKDIMIISNHNGGTLKVQTTHNLIHTLSLNKEKLWRLNQLANQCESCFGKSLDIEWSFSDNRLFLLQCRKITNTTEVI